MSAQYREQQRRNAVQMLANDENGRAFLRWLLVECDMMSFAGVPTELAWAGFRAGHREIGDKIQNLIFDAGLPADQVADIFRREAKDE